MSDGAIDIPNPDEFLRVYRMVVARLEATANEQWRAEYKLLIDIMRDRWAASNGGDGSELDDVAFGR